MGSGEAKRFRDMYSSAGRHGDSFWKEEKDNVGMKLLKSMGWDMGQGLGKDGNGRTSAVKQFRRKDNAGIGATAGTRDEAYRASQDLFNDVLSRLSGGGGEEDSSADTAKSLGSGANTVKGMVAKRQMIRRFVPGGTAKTASDMAAILGKSVSVTPAVGGFPVMEAMGADDNAEKADEGKDNEGRYASNVSLNDYFAKRRRELGLPESAGPSESRAKGFTLDDQTMFAETQAEMAYSGRRGLGLGGSYDDDEPAKPAPAATKRHAFWQQQERERQQQSATFAPPSAPAAVAPPTAPQGAEDAKASKAAKKAAKEAKKAKKADKAAKKAAKEAKKAKKAEKDAKGTPQEQEAKKAKEGAKEDTKEEKASKKESKKEKKAKRKPVSEAAAEAPAKKQKKAKKVDCSS